MSKGRKPDFTGYASKYDVKCTDGRTILKGAFAKDDQKRVPLVWQHQHNDPENVLGHATIQNRPDGAYVEGFFNDTSKAAIAKALVAHGDIAFLSIYANELIEQNKLVKHGRIREVSLVLAGANAGAKIDYVAIEHADGDITMSDEDAVIFSDTEISFDAISHEEKNMPNDKTIGEVFETLSEEQKTAVYAILGAALEKEDEEMEQSGLNDYDEGDDSVMKNNAFDAGPAGGRPALTHDQMTQIFTDAKKIGSFRTAFLAHAAEYGIENIDYLFPDHRTLQNEPTFVTRDMGWVTQVLADVRKTPFSRIKTVQADITADDARALGYTKGGLKKEEFFTLMKRTTSAATIYKKQKLDRDDVVEITDFDVVAWMRKEMRVMLDEELARAILVSDGRDADSEDKIKEDNIRPIWKDADLYAHHVLMASTVNTAEKILEEIIKARKNYKGSGSPKLYVGTDLLTDMLLIKDTTGRRIYRSVSELAAELRVSDIVEVAVMDGRNRVIEATTYDLMAIMVNLSDYSLGADKGGEINSFEDFDIDYNQMKYLLETRCSGALTQPKSALVFERARAG